MNNGQEKNESRASNISGESEIQSKRFRYAKMGLRCAIYGLALGGMQEIHNTWLSEHSGPGIIRLLTVEIGGICRVICVSNTPGMKKTLLPEIALLLINTIQISQYIFYELLV